MFLRKLKKKFHEKFFDKKIFDDLKKGNPLEDTKSVFYNKTTRVH